MRKMLLLLYFALYLNSNALAQSDLLTYVQNGQRTTLVATSDTQQSTLTSRNTAVLQYAMQQINYHGVIEIYPGNYPVNTIDIPDSVRLNFKRRAVFTFTNNQLVGSFPLVKIL